MKTHTTKGANILRPVSQLKEMLPGIELHHESLDGRGYPYGLKGDQVPLLARVIAVADTFDALTTNRPYQRAYDPQEALKIIQGLVKKRLDTKAAAALIAVYERGEIRVRRMMRAQATPPSAETPAAVSTPALPPASVPAVENKAAAVAATASPADPVVETTRF